MSSYREVKVLVSRSQGGPTFNPSSYNHRINEDYSTGVDIAIITLTDPDNDVCIFCCLSAAVT